MNSPQLTTNRLSLTRENGVVELFEISGAFGLFEEDGVHWLTIQAESTKPISLSKEAEYPPDARD